MRLKIRNTRIIISFSFFALILLSCVCKDNTVFLASLFISLLHECVHLLFIILFRCRVSEICLSFMGGEIKRGEDTVSRIKEAVISLSAPIVNIIMGILLLIHNKNSLVGIVSLLVGVMNILPYDDFDGGRGLRFLLQNKISAPTLDTIIVTLSFVVCFSFLSLNLYLIKNNRENILFLMMSVGLLILLVFRVFVSPKSRCKYL